MSKTPKFDPNSPKARRLRASNDARRAAEASAAQPVQQQLTEWTAVPGVGLARDYEGVGRVVVSRQRMYGTRKHLHIAMLRKQDGDATWERVNLPADVARDQRGTTDWLDTWASSQRP